MTNLQRQRWWGHILNTLVKMRILQYFFYGIHNIVKPSRLSEVRKLESRIGNLIKPKLFPRSITSNVGLWKRFLPNKIKRFRLLTTSSGKLRGLTHLVLKCGPEKYHISPDFSTIQASSLEVSVTRIDLPK